MADALALRGQLDVLKNEYSECKRVDTNKYNLIEKLFEQIEHLRCQLDETQSDLRKEKDLEGLYLERASDYKGQLEDLKHKIASSSFVSVLVDGDCMLFKDDLVKQGSDGGLEAAYSLKRAVEQYVKSTLQMRDPLIKIVIRVYANMKGISQTYEEAGIIAEQYGFEEFVRGFNKAEPLCDYVDAGDEKECSDVKINESFKMHMTDIHCQHVILGGSADNGYARLLGPYSASEEQAEHITMLEGPPFARDLLQFVGKFATTSFEDVFRKTKISRRVSFNITPPTTPIPNYAAAVAVSVTQQTPATTSTSNGELHAAAIARNRKGQRVDLPLRFFQIDVDDLKRRKLCNSYHLLGVCRFRNCTHVHGASLSDNQFEALRVVARLTPCGRGLTCVDESCIAGHQCPRSGCGGMGCRFPQEMHGVDRNVM